MINTCYNNLSNLLIQADKFCDTKPFLSTIASIVNLFQKCVLACIGEQRFSGNKYFNYVYLKDLKETIWLLIPFIGNYIVNEQRTQALLPPKPLDSLQVAKLKITPQTPQSSIVPLDNLDQKEITKAVVGDSNTSLQNPNLYVTYRGLSDERRKEMRINMYEDLFPLVAKKMDSSTNGVYLPCITGYSGEKIFLSTIQKILVIHMKDANNNLKREIRIGKDGFCNLIEHSIFGSEPDYNINIFDENQFSYNEEDYEIRIENRKEYLHLKKGGAKITTTEEFYHHGPAFLELMTFKWDQILSFLKNNDQGVAQTVFQNCLALFKKMGSVNVSNNNKAIILTSQEETYKIGPMISPVNSQDSTFTWTVSKKNGKSSISFEKTSIGRAFHQSSGRELIISQTQKKPDEIELTIHKTNGSDMHDESSTSKYSLTIKGDRFMINPLGIEKHSETWVPFAIYDLGTGKILGFDPYLVQENSIQSAIEMRQDIEFAMKALTTVGDIYSNPHTLILEKEDKKPVCYNLQGQKMPTEYICQRLRFDQGIDGYSALAYHTNIRIKTLHGKLELEKKPEPKLMLTESSS